MYRKKIHSLFSLSLHKEKVTTTNLAPTFTYSQSLNSKLSCSHTPFFASSS